MKNLKLIAAIVFFFSLTIGFSQEKEATKPSLKTNNEKVSISKPMALFILDGVPVTQEIGEIINPDHIESVNVIKGEKSMAIYGERGKDGAIIIKTKSQFEAETKELQKMYAYQFSSNEKEEKVVILGVITDFEDAKLSNITITNLNSKQTFQSDSEGRYRLLANQNDVLEYVFPGFESQRILVQKKSEVNIKLKAASKI